jgi:murein DD-endopeptidase MepM/ murein hydrolase activator NlpD
MADLQTYLTKFNELTRNLNVTDDKILHAEKLTDAQKDELLNNRLKTWGELDFLRTRLTEMFTNAEYTPEYTKLAELSAEYEITRAENEVLRKQTDQVADNVQQIADADAKIVDTVSKMTNEKVDELRQQLKTINSTIATLGLNERELVERVNKYTNALVGAAFNPLKMDDDLDPKYQKLADGLELWNGLAKLTRVLPMGAPVSDIRVTSSYGTRKDPFTGKPKMHRGIDFAGKIGTELMAVAPGRVISAGERVGYGLTVEVDHGLGFTTLYAHLSQAKVARGDWVRPGTVVGLGGSSGRSTGPHLHYEIRYKGEPFNPSNFVKE